VPPARYSSAHRLSSRMSLPRHNRQSEDDGGSLAAGSASDAPRGVMRSTADALRGGAPSYAVDEKPPDWSGPTPSGRGGIWEIPVEPLQPSVPGTLPPWAQAEYDAQLQRLMLAQRQGGGGGRSVLGGAASVLTGGAKSAALPGRVTTACNYPTQVRRVVNGPLTEGGVPAAPSGGSLVSTCL